MSRGHMGNTIPCDRPFLSNTQKRSRHLQKTLAPKQRCAAAPLEHNQSMAGPGMVIGNVARFVGQVAATAATAYALQQGTKWAKKKFRRSSRRYIRGRKRSRNYSLRTYSRGRGWRSYTR